MQTKRLYYLDWLRVLVILSLIPFHASLTYLRFGSVYIKSPVSGLSTLPFLFVSVPLGDFFMTLLFFVSGMASFYSFKNRSSDGYIGERLKRLMRPLLLGFLFLCPETAYLQAIYQGYQGNFFSFIPQFFYYKFFYYPAYGHLWFLLYLFNFSLLCVPLFNRWQRYESRIERLGSFLIRRQHMLLPIGTVIMLELLLRPFFNGSLTFIFDWANDAVYLFVFVCGYVFAADARIQVKLKEYFRWAIIFGLLSLATLFFVNVKWQVLGSNDAFLTPLWVLAKGVYECSAIIFLLCIGKTHLNRSGRVIGYLSSASFTVYIFHFLPVTYFTLLFINLKIPVFIKFLLVVILSYITVFMIYELWRRMLSFKEHMKLKSRNA